MQNWLKQVGLCRIATRRIFGGAEWRSASSRWRRLRLADYLLYSISSVGRWRPNQSASVECGKPQVDNIQRLATNSRAHRPLPFLYVSTGVETTSPTLDPSPVAVASSAFIGETIAEWLQHITADGYRVGWRSPRLIRCVRSSFLLRRAFARCRRRDCEPMENKQRALENLERFLREDRRVRLSKWPRSGKRCWPSRLSIG